MSKVKGKTNKLSFEEDCSQKGNYKFIATNIIPPELRAVQEASIRSTFLLQESGEARPCGCSEKNKKKCTGNACFNRSYRIACPASCGSACQNNPWRNHLFVISVKTVMKQTASGKGNGIFATRKILYQEYVAEYTGEVKSRDTEFNEIDGTYVFDIEFLSQCIDSSKIGNSARCLNHSCEPNVRSVVIAHNLEYKMVFIAKKSIGVGEELTIDYKWVYDSIEEAQKCYCGTRSCTGYIGKLKSELSKSERRRRRIDAPSNESDDECEDVETLNVVPKVFASIMKGSRSSVSRLLSTRQIEEDRPVNFTERHVFNSLDYAYFICVEDGSVRIGGGRVVECYESEAKIIIYVIHQAHPAKMDYHLPRWLCFHHQIDASFRLSHVYSEGDRNRIMKYYRVFVSDRMARRLRQPIVTDYVQRWQAGDIPPAEYVRHEIRGSAAIGLASHELRLVQATQRDEESSSTEGTNDTEEETTTPSSIFESQSPVSSGPPTPVQSETQWYSASETQALLAEPGSKKKQVARKRAQILRPTSADFVECRRLDGNDEHEQATVVPAESIENDIVGNESLESVDHGSVTFAGDGYDPMARKQLDELKPMIQNEDHLQRCFDYAVETVASFATLRIKKAYRIPYLELHDNVLAELRYYYYLASPEKQRFLNFNHYRLKCEVVAPGSWHWWWCSLCKLSSTFKNQMEIWRHFQSHHSIVAPLYQCPGCPVTFNIPSELRTHVIGCAPAFASALRTDVDPFVLDAFADFIACRTSDYFKPMYLNTPGLISFKNVNEGSRKKGVKQDRPVIVMNLVTKKPMDPRYLDYFNRTKFNIQQDYTTITKWKFKKLKGDKSIQAQILRGGVHYYRSSNMALPASTGSNRSVKRQKGYPKKRNVTQVANGRAGAEQQQQQQDAPDEDEETFDRRGGKSSQVTTRSRSRR